MLLHCTSETPVALLGLFTLHWLPSQAGYGCRTDLIRTFKLEETKLARFLWRIEEGYPNNPYHNRTHAADVLQSTFMLITQGGLSANRLCHMAAIMAAVSMHTTRGLHGHPCWHWGCMACIRITCQVCNCSQIMIVTLVAVRRSCMILSTVA